MASTNQRPVFTIKMHPREKQKLQKVAFDQNTSMAHIVINALHEYYKKHKL